MALELPSLPLAQDTLKGVRPSMRFGTLLDPTTPGAPGADRFAPKYLLVVNGATLGEFVTNYITSVEFEDNEDLFNKLEIQLAGMIFDTKLQKEIPVPQWVQSSTIFSEGNIVWLYLGYGGNLRLVGGAEIVARAFTYGPNPTCTITAYDPIHRMTTVAPEESKTYKGMLASEIARQISKKGDYSGTIGGLFATDTFGVLPAFTPRAEVQKRGETDYAFLKRMADIRGWRLYSTFDEDKTKFQLYFGPDPDKNDGVFRYEHNRIDLLTEDKLLEFTPVINVIDQHADVEITAIDEKRAKKVGHKTAYQTLAAGDNRKFVGNKTDFEQGELKNGHNYRFQAFGVTKKIITNRPFKDEQEAKKFVIQWARKNIKNFITGSGKVVGNESIQARQLNFFAGLGETFSGTDSKPAKWYMTKVKHKISRSGGSLVYDTTFDCRKVIDFLPDDDLTASLGALAGSVAGAGAAFLTL